MKGIKVKPDAKSKPALGDKVGDPLPSTMLMFCVFEALRRMGWPSDNIYFINAVDAASGRRCAFVTLQDLPTTPPKFAFRAAFLDKTPDALVDIGKHIERWNGDAQWRTTVWEAREEFGFENVPFAAVLVSKGLNVGPEKAS